MSAPERPPLPALAMGLASTVQTPQPITDSMLTPEDIVEITSFEFKDTLNAADKSDIASRSSQCDGYMIILRDGHSPYSSYPFALHTTLSLPWVPQITLDGSLRLVSQSCLGTTTSADIRCCHACQKLSLSTALEGILARIEDGVHENSGFAYYGFSGLHNMLNHKNQWIEFYQLRGLIQARKLLGRVVVLADNMCLLMAISSGQTKRLDRVISIGLRQKKGYRGLLASVIAAAQGHYKPKLFTEEEDRKAILVWKLAGNRVAEIEHNSAGAPSVSYLRTRSIVPHIIPSPAQPEVHHVMSNIKVTLESILDEIHSIRTGKSLHTVVMFDELTTEKKIHWDPKTNNFLGICRQHAHKTSVQFINEGDVEELFQHIDEGDVHYAGEVREPTW